MADDAELERRIRERAHRIWLEEGKPHGRDREHWEIAKLAIAEEDALPSMLKRPELPRPEPIEAVENQAEFPELTDQAEDHLPGDIRKQ
jgi:hypothetical protein